MGQCYTVELRMKSKDEAKTLEAIRANMNRNPCHADFALETWKANGGETETMDGLVRLMLTGMKWYGVVTTDEKGFTIYRNDFSASYGWLFVMKSFFEEIAPTLEDGSEFFIEGDTDSLIWTVVDGEVI